MNGEKPARASLRPCREGNDGLIGADLHAYRLRLYTAIAQPGAMTFPRRSSRFRPDTVKLSILLK